VTLDIPWNIQTVWTRLRDHGWACQLTYTDQPLSITLNAQKGPHALAQTWRLTANGAQPHRSQD
jgi:hypothetical protein